MIVLTANSPYDVAYLESVKVDAMVTIDGHKSFETTDPSLLKQLTTYLEAGELTLFTDQQRPELFNRLQGANGWWLLKAAVTDACSYLIGHA